MKVMKYYKRPDKPEIVILDEITEKPKRNIPAEWLLISYPINLTKGRRLNMWIDSKTVYIDWIREFKDG